MGRACEGVCLLPRRGPGSPKTVVSTAVNSGNATTEAKDLFQPVLRLVPAATSEKTETNMRIISRAGGVTLAATLLTSPVFGQEIGQKVADPQSDQTPRGDGSRRAEDARSAERKRSATLEEVIVTAQKREQRL
jgi:hypothetical protein